MKTSILKAPAHVNIMVALDCEAKPLVAHFGLKRERQQSTFATYRNDQNLTLVVCGPGKPAMASACGYLYGVQTSQGNEPSAWLNVGVAGHRTLKVGTPLLIQKVKDSTSGHRYYPPLLLHVDCRYCDLLSVDLPESEYREDCAYDMEATAFYGSASRFITSELVQIIKVISDNQDDPTTNVTKAKVQELITKNLGVIESVISQLRRLSADYNSVHGPVEEFIQLEKKVHLTANQRIQLERLVRQLKVKNSSGLNDFLLQNKSATAKTMINDLKQLVEA